MGCEHGTEAKQWWVLARHQGTLRIAFVRGFCPYPDAQTRIFTSRRGLDERITIEGPRSGQPHDACSISPACATIVEPPGTRDAPLLDGRTGRPPDPVPRTVKSEVDRQCVARARLPADHNG